MENEIRMCFYLWTTHMKNTIKDLRNYDTTNMTVNQIKAETDIIYMKYILASSYSISDSSVGVISYNHLKKMIECSNTEKNYNKIENELKMLNLENEKLKLDLNDLKSKLSSMLFDSFTTTDGTITVPKGSSLSIPQTEQVITDMPTLSIPQGDQVITGSQKITISSNNSGQSSLAPGAKSWFF